MIAELHKEVATVRAQLEERGRRLECTRVKLEKLKTEGGGVHGALAAVARSSPMQQVVLLHFGLCTFLWSSDSNFLNVF